MINQVGDSPLLEWQIRDPQSNALVDATVTCTLTSPSGTTVALAVSHSGVGLYDTLAPLTSAGEWLVTWTATGTVTASDSVALYAATNTAPWIVPSWAPTLWDVGSLIPTRTRAIGIDDTYTGTFTADTQPTDEQAIYVVNLASRWAAGPLGTPIVDVAGPLLTMAAALYAAYLIELGYPERDADVQVYEAFLVQANAARDVAKGVNDANGGGTLADVDEDRQLVVWSFPGPPAWADVQTFS